MFDICVFAGSGGVLGPRGGLHITLFGGQEFARAPAVRQVLAQRRRSEGEGQPGHHFFLTLFGATSIAWPTITDEYLALVEALRSGALTLADWDRHITTIGLPHVHALTLFGGFDAHEIPEEDKEVDSLALQRHLGHIPDQVAEMLMHAIGRDGLQRLEVVRQAAAAALNRRS